MSGPQYVDLKLTDKQLELLHFHIRVIVNRHEGKRDDKMRLLAIWKRFARRRGNIVRKTKLGVWYETPSTKGRART